MIKPLSLALLLFPTLGACTMMDDHYYGNSLHRTSALVVQVPGSPVGAHRNTAPPPQVHGHDARQHHRRNLPAHARRGRVQPNIHGHQSKNNTVHGHVDKQYHGHD